MTTATNNHYESQLTGSDSFSNNITDFYDDYDEDISSFSNKTDLKQTEDLAQKLLLEHDYEADDDNDIEEDDDEEENDDDDEEKFCKHCGKLILEGHAYELGDDRWHIDCFRCSKCSNLLGIDSDFLVVGTGELVCENCFYDCQVCGKKIGDLAILAGNQPYCADCFVCKHCKNRIDNLRYAKTSSGLYCMNCHEKVLQKKKKLEQEKKRRHLKRNSSSRNVTPILEKSLPSIPPKNSTTDLYNHDEKSNSLASFNSPFESEDLSLDNTTNNTSPILNNNSASSKRLSISSDFSQDGHELDIIHSPKYQLNSPPPQPPQLPTHFAKKKPSYDRNLSFERKTNTKSEIINQVAEYSDYDSNVMLMDPPKKTKQQQEQQQTPQNNNSESSKRNPISSRAANNRKIVYVDEDTSTEENSSVNEESEFDIISPVIKDKSNTHDLKNQIKKSSDGLRQLTSPKQSKFKSTTPTSPHHESTSGKLGRSLSIKSPKAILQGINNRHKRSSSNMKETLNNYDFNEPILSSHSRSSSDILNSYASETSTIRMSENNLGHGHTRSINNIELDYSSMKSEMSSMSSKIVILKEEISYLSNAKENLQDEVSELTLTLQKIKFQIEKEKKILDHNRSINHSEEDFNNTIKYKTSSRNISEHSISEHSDEYYSSKNDEPIYFQNTPADQITPTTKKPPLTITTANNSNNSNNNNNANGAFSVQPYSSSILTPTTDDPTNDNFITNNIESVQAAVKPKVKARFWRSKGFGKFKETTKDENENSENGSAFKISAPVLQHLDEEAFNQMNNKHRANGSHTPNSGNSATNKTKGINFLDKFSSSMVSSASQNNLSPGDLLSKSPLTGQSSGTAVSQQHSQVPSLVEKSTREGRDVPLLILTCIKVVEQNGLYSEGIYRKSGSTSQIQNVEQLFDSIKDNADSIPEELEYALNQDINVVSSVLKRYLRRLPEPIITHALYDQFISCATIKRSDKKIEKIKSVILQLPKQHRLTLNLIAKHLNLISQYSESNFMNLHNLAIVFAPSLVRDLTGEKEIVDMVNKNDVTEFLVSNYRSIF